MKMIKAIRSALSALVAVVMFAVAAPALAQDAVLDQAKAQGQVGEMYNGYLGVVDGASVSADVRRRVDEVNAKRLAAYTELSKKSGEPVTTVAALTAEKLIARASSGEKVKAGSDQGWKPKP
ncbi:MAG: YdbL family protein [Hyphomonadaceae bacterium]